MDGRAGAKKDPLERLVALGAAGFKKLWGVLLLERGAAGRGDVGFRRVVPLAL